MDNRNYNDQNTTPKSMRLWFGVFMVMFYVGVGLLLIIANQTFTLFTTTLSIIVGASLCAYGVFRAYRLYKGLQ